MTLERPPPRRHAGLMLVSSFRWSVPALAALALTVSVAVTACGNTGDGGGNSGDSAGGSGDPGSGSSSSDTGGTNGSGSGSGSGGSGSTDSGDETGRCYDEPCLGRCVGSCSGGWTCETDVACTDDLRQYCGCDGTTFSGSGSCPQLGYANQGECIEPETGSVNCDPADITCLPLVPPEPCPEGQVHSVESGCHGTCVPIDSCACSAEQECPDPNQYVCLNGPGHCSYYLR